eukprot:27931_1
MMKCMRGPLGKSLYKLHMMSPHVMYKLSFITFCLPPTGDDDKFLSKSTFHRTQMHFWRENSIDNMKQLNEKPKVKTIPKGVNDDVKSHLNNCSNGKQVLSVIKSHQNQINHSSLYGKAIQLCTKWNDFDSAIQVMKLFESSPVKLKADQIIFNIFFDCMAHADLPELASKYFDIMLNKYKLSPNNITFSCLIKGCRRQSKHHEATKYWCLMKQFNIIPQKQQYTEMLSVYSKAKQEELAENIFQEYLAQVESKQLPINIPTFAAYLNVFSRSGNIEGLHRTLPILIDYGICSNGTIASDIMRTYVVARNEIKALEYFDSYISNGNEPTVSMMYLKCVALSLTLIHSEFIQYEFETKYELYTEIVNTIWQQMKQYQMKIDPLFIRCQLSAAIGLYHNVNPAQIVDIFHSLLKTGYIGYKGKKGMEIDLHLCQLLDAQFILRYVIGYKLNELLKTQRNLHLVVGSGKHGSGTLRGFVITELLSYDPPIAAKPHEWDKAVLVVSLKDLQSYLKNKSNIARLRLNIPSNDWFLDRLS